MLFFFLLFFSSLFSLITVANDTSDVNKSFLLLLLLLSARSLRVKNDLPPHSKSYPCQMTEQIHLDDEKFFTIVLPKENSPLGIHVVPASTNEDQVNGLVLQNIEADGRVKRQGILQINDRIIEINRKNIERCSFDNAQMIFRSALLEPELELKIVRSLKKPPIPPRPASFRSQNVKTRSTLSEIHPNKNDPTLIDVDANLHALNTRRLGKILHINLTKGLLRCFSVKRKYRFNQSF